MSAGFAVGFIEQIFGVNEQILGTGSERLRGVGPPVGCKKQMQSKGHVSTLEKKLKPLAKDD